MGTRRPSYSMGLDELLGMTKNKMTPKLTSSIPERPSTRHGRTSVTGSSQTSTNSSEKSKENKSPSLTELISNHTVDVWSNENEVESPVQFDDSPSKYPTRKLSNIRSISSSSSNLSKISTGGTSATKTKSIGNLPKTPQKLINRQGSNPAMTRSGTHETISRPQTNASNVPTPPPRKSKSANSKNNKLSKQAEDIKKEFEKVKQKQGERTAYTLWLERKLEEQKQKNREEKEKADKLREEQQRKLDDAKKAFERWNQDRAKEMKLKKQKELEKQRKKQEELEQQKEERKKECDKMFEYWKNNKLTDLKMEKERQKAKEEAERRNLEKSKREKEKEALQSFSAWKQQHKEALMRMRRQQEEEQQKQLEEQRQINHVKQQLANDAFMLWMKMKEKQEDFEKSLAYRVLQYEDETKHRKSQSPWIPVGGRSVIPVPRRSSMTSLNSQKRTNSAKKVHFNRRTLSATKARNQV
uniref:Microtubule-associated protein 9 n=1 Tax=Panagrolaimus sp. JU765 TaxID=591449 RepID=A0AC34QT29_9BILA